MCQNELEETKLKLLSKKNDELESQLHIAHKQLEQLQVENKKIIAKYMELKDKEKHTDIMVCSYVCTHACTILAFKWIASYYTYAIIIYCIGRKIEGIYCTTN